MSTRVVSCCAVAFVIRFATLALATDYHFVRIADTRDGPYFLDLARHPAINNAGSVAFWRQHTSGGGIGYYIGNGGAQNPIVLDTDPALMFQSLHQLSLNDGGDIAFYTDSLSVGFRVYKATPAGTLSVIAASGAGSFSSIDDYPTINNSGAVAFKAGSRAFVNAGLGNLEYYGPTTPATGVAVSSSPFISNAGQLALSGSYGLATGGNAYLRGSGEPPTIIADGATTITSFGSKSSVNDGGVVVFGTSTSAPGGEVIYTGMGFNVLIKIADNSGPYVNVATEDGGGAGGTPAINNSGTVAFVARLSSGTLGIFTGADPSTTRVVQTGSTLFGRTLTNSIGGLGRDAINDAGEITFEAGLFDGSSVSSVVAKAVPFTPMKWDHDGNGSWSVGGNWLGGVPNAYQHEANFTDAITSPRTVTVDGAFTVGTIHFDNLNKYTVSGPAGSITLDDSFGGTLDVTSGSHELNTPLIIRGKAEVIVGPGAELKLGGGVSGDGSTTLRKSGAGTLRPLYWRIGTMNIAGGKVSALPNGTSAATSRVNQLTLAGATDAWTAQLDLADNDMVIDYPIGGPSPLVTIHNQIKNGYASGAWTGNGIISSLAGSGKALGYADNPALGLSTFSGQAIDATTVLIKYTYAGDANLDGQVDVTDLGALATNWQTSASWTGGDFNYDGFVDVTDLGALATNWQAGVGSPLGRRSLDPALAAVGFGGISVPESGTAALSMGLLLGSLITARRRFRS